MEDNITINVTIAEYINNNGPMEAEKVLELIKICREKFGLEQGEILKLINHHCAGRKQQDAPEQSI